MGSSESTVAGVTHTKMSSKVLLLCFVGLVSCASPPPPAGYAPAPDPYPAVPPSYNYQYGVNDPQYGPVFSQQEERTDYNTAGEYRVNLPDGRVQIVSYSAGPEGYVADVKYEGEPVYPEAKPYAPAPAPYKPAPAPYRPAPAPAPYKPAPAPYKPAPAPYKPAPAPYRPAPAPVYHAAPVYNPAPYKPAKKYGFSLVTTAAPEAKAAPVAEEEETPAESTPAPVEAAPVEAAAAKEAPAPAYQAAAPAPAAEEAEA